MSLIERVRYAQHAARAIRESPYEGLERVLEKLAESADERRPSESYEVAPRGEAQLHESVGATWPCPLLAEFEDVWAEVMAGLRARGVRTGRGAFGGWDDADPGLARLAWCLAVHLRPRTVVETGVARGVTTAILLRAIERNGFGHLCSIDLPPLLEQDLQAETGIAVAEPQPERWTLLRGSSRRMLPGLVAGLGGLRLFVHDSMHTTRNVLFELNRVWPALTAGGAMLVDDIERNSAFAAFTRAHPQAQAIIVAADDGQALVGCLLKPASSGDVSASGARR
jgi:methyltransferase family protein